MSTLKDKNHFTYVRMNLIKRKWYIMLYVNTIVQLQVLKFSLCCSIVNIFPPDQTKFVLCSNEIEMFIRKTTLK